MFTSVFARPEVMPPDSPDNLQGTFSSRLPSYDTHYTLKEDPRSRRVPAALLVLSTIGLLTSSEAQPPATLPTPEPMEVVNTIPTGKPNIISINQGPKGPMVFINMGPENAVPIPTTDPVVVSINMDGRIGTYDSEDLQRPH